jgi:hypothetical protein
MLSKVGFCDELRLLLPSPTRRLKGMAIGERYWADLRRLSCAPASISRSPCYLSLALLMLWGLAVIVTYYIAALSEPSVALLLIVSQLRVAWVSFEPGIFLLSIILYQTDDLRGKEGSKRPCSRIKVWISNSTQKQQLVIHQRIGLKKT